jgi:hypothetical protein
MSKNLTNLTDLLFSQLEKLSDDSLTGDQLKEQAIKNKEIIAVSKQLIEVGKLGVAAIKAKADLLENQPMPEYLRLDHK